jgi:two-component system chemotaxis response regulator CheY
LASALASLKVCIVDSEGDMCRMIREALNSLGISEIRECADSSSAQQVIGEFDPDLCLLDSSTGPVDAITFVKSVRGAESNRRSEMQLIMMVSNANTRRVIEARNAGVDEFLVKPISARGLHSRLLTLVDNPRLFVRTVAYTGPDRRRHCRPFVGPDRREKSPDATVNAPAEKSDAPATTRTAS